MGNFFSDLFGGSSTAEKNLGKVSTAPFESDFLQGALPPSLRLGATGDMLGAGVQGIGDLLRNPGGLSPNVADAIKARLAVTSEGIARDFRGIRSQQAGAGARGNVPISIRTALDSALNVAQERAQRGARRGALMDSETLRRQNLSQVYALLDAILQFQSSARGQGIAGLGAAANLANLRAAGKQAFVGSVLSSGPGGGGGRGGGAGAGPPSETGGSGGGF
jgi:hypothetical protein